MRCVLQPRKTSALAAGVFWALFFGTAATAQELILSAPWGDKPGQAGLVNQPEHERIGPVSFCMDGDEALLLDTVHHRILRGKVGADLRTLGRDVAGSSLCVDGAGTIWIQNGEQIDQLDRDGNPRPSVTLARKGKADRPATEGYGIELVRDSQGRVCLQGLNQERKPVSDSAPATAPSAASSTPGKPLRYCIKRMAGNEVRLLGFDADDKDLVTLPIRIDNGQAGAVLFKGTDARGNLYVEVERLVGNRAELEVHRYAPTGERLRVFPLPNDYFTTVYKKTEIHPDGSVCQVQTTPEGVRVVRYPGEVK